MKSRRQTKIDETANEVSDKTLGSEIDVHSQTAQDSDNESLVLLTVNTDTEVEENDVQMERIFTHTLDSATRKLLKSQFRNVADKQNSAELGMRELKALRVQRRQERKKISNREKNIARLACPMPNIATVALYEHFFCQLDSCLKRVQESEFPHLAVLARLSVFFSFVAIDTGNILINISSIHENTSPRCTQRGKGAKRGIVTTSFLEFSDLLADVSKSEQERILTNYNYTRTTCIESIEALSEVYQQLSAKFGSIANEFYSPVPEKEVFNVCSYLDYEFEFISREELMLHLENIFICLQKGLKLFQVIDSPVAVTQSLKEVLEDLDDRELNFLSPKVLPNIDFKIRNCVEGDRLNILGYLEKSKAFFKPYLSSATLLRSIELSHENVCN